MGARGWWVLLLVLALVACGHATDAATDAGPSLRDGSLGDAAEGCKQRLVFEDRDGDGRGDETRSRFHCGDEPPEGYAFVGYDCDDDDPDTVVPGYLDRDGDSYGDPADEACHPFPLPDGVAQRAGDCDDTDPLRHPEGFELFGDAEDGDCDGSDGAALQTACTCEAVLTTGAPLETECTGSEPYFGVLDGVSPGDAAAVFGDADALTGQPTCQGEADLAIHTLLRCATCFVDVVYVVVANLGAAEARNVVLTVQQDWPAEGTTLRIPLADLPARSRTALMALPALHWTSTDVRVVSDGPDCNADNDAVTLDIYRYECGLYD